jgi:hypothetical protein
MNQGAIISYIVRNAKPIEYRVCPKRKEFLIENAFFALKSGLLLQFRRKIIYLMLSMGLDPVLR